MAQQSYLDFERNNSPDEVEAYRTNFGAFKSGLTREEIAEYYNKWADSGMYDVVRISYSTLSPLLLLLSKITLFKVIILS